MSYGYRIYRRDPLLPGSNRPATYSELAAAGGFQRPGQAKDAAARAASEPAYDSAGPGDVAGYLIDIFQE